MIKTDLIKARFNKASGSYDAVAQAQQEAALFLVEHLKSFEDFSPKTVLDVGAGTGVLTALLRPYFPGAHFYLNDIADKMLDQCRARFGLCRQVDYLLGDMNALDEQRYSAVVSNLALQWAPDLAQTLKFLKNKSEEVFAFSTLVAGTFSQWEVLVSSYQPFKALAYPTQKRLTALCTALKAKNETFTFYTKDIPLTFPGVQSFMHYLKCLGATAAPIKIQPSHLRAMLKRQTPLTVQYKIFFALFRKGTR